MFMGTASAVVTDEEVIARMKRRQLKRQVWRYRDLGRTIGNIFPSVRQTETYRRFISAVFDFRAAYKLPKRDFTIAELRDSAVTVYKALKVIAALI